MDKITYGRITEENFTRTSLDSFIRRQEVQECWRRVDGQWKLLPIAYVEDCDISERRCYARTLLEEVRAGAQVYGAWEEGQVVGFAQLERQRTGSAGQYLVLHAFYVSEPCRGRGIGKNLFRLACQGARELGASKLYISAHSAKESIAAYRKYGCVEAMEVNQILAEEEPFDMQLEFQL